MGVLREVLQHIPIPSRGAELPFRAQKDLRARDEDSSQEGQEVQLHQGLQGAAQGNLRPVWEENYPALMRHPGEVGLYLRACRDLSGGEDIVLVDERSTAEPSIVNEKSHLPGPLVLFSLVSS